MGVFTLTLQLLCFLLVLCPAVIARTSTGCLAGFTRRGDQCFKVTSRASFSKAKKECESQGGGLVEILNWRTQRHVEQFLKQYRIRHQVLWLGGHFALINGNVRVGLQWFSTLYAPITNFEEYDKVFEENNCVVVNPNKNFHWESRPCTTSFRGLCAVRYGRKLMPDRPRFKTQFFSLL